MQILNIHCLSLLLADDDDDDDYDSDEVLNDGSQGRHHLGNASVYRGMIYHF